MNKHDFEITEQHKEGKFIGDLYKCKNCPEEHLCGHNVALRPSCIHLSSFNFGCIDLQANREL